MTNRSEYWKLAVRSMLMLWPATFGIWPLLDTGHNPFTNPWAIVDLAVHIAAWWWIWNRWHVVPRHRPRKSGTITVTINADTRSFDEAMRALREMRALRDQINSRRPWIVDEDKP